jgi:hypothetical protein
MGFALWIDGDTAWCAGTHEYRPMGVAVIAASALFIARDFDRNRQPPPQRAERFQGLFASLVDVNHHLRRSRSHVKRKNLASTKTRLLSVT